MISKGFPTVSNSFQSFLKDFNVFRKRLHGPIDDQNRELKAILKERGKKIL